MSQSKGSDPLSRGNLPLGQQLPCPLIYSKTSHLFFPIWSNLLLCQIISISIQINTAYFSIIFLFSTLQQMSQKFPFFPASISFSILLELIPIKFSIHYSIKTALFKIFLVGFNPNCTWHFSDIWQQWALFPYLSSFPHSFGDCIPFHWQHFSIFFTGPHPSE